MKMWRQGDCLIVTVPAVDGPPFMTFGLTEAEYQPLAET
jgi:hypothetical protein